MKKKSLRLMLLAAAFMGIVASVSGQQMKIIPDHPLVNAKSVNECVAGGPGSTSCTINANVQVENFGIGGNCSVSCQGDYYACCGYTCRCVLNINSDLIFP